MASVVTAQLIGSVLCLLLTYGVIRIGTHRYNAANGEERTLLSRLLYCLFTAFVGLPSVYFLFIVHLFGGILALVEKWDHITGTRYIAQTVS